MKLHSKAPNNYPSLFLCDLGSEIKAPILSAPTPLCLSLIASKARVDFLVGCSIRDRSRLEHGSSTTAAIMPKQKDELWEFFKPVHGHKQKIECKFCEKIISGGITRGRYHLSKLPDRDVEPCMKVPTSVQKKASDDAQRLEEGKNKRLKLSDPSDVMMKPTDPTELEKNNMEACKAFTRWAFSQSIPLHSLKSPHFLQACSLVAKNGHEYEPLSGDFKQKKVISELNQEATSYMQSVKQSCRTLGCTLVMDIWAIGPMHYFILMAVSLKNTTLLKSLCWPGLPSSDRIEELTSSFIRVMGPRNVVQILEPNGYLLPGFDARIYNQTGVFVTWICKSLYTNVISCIYTTNFCNNVYETCKKIVELLYSNAGYRDLMKMYTNGQEIQQCHGSNFERQFVTLKLVLNAEKSLRLMFASVEMSVQDPNVTEVKKIIEGIEFWEHGKKNIMAMESLLKAIRLIDGYTSNLGYIYHAFLKAREATEVLLEVNEGYSLSLEDACREMSRKMDHSLYKIGAYLNPHLFYDKEVRLSDEDIDSLEEEIGLMVHTSDRDELLKVLKSYRAQDTKIFGAAAIKSVRTLHPRVWWERWGGKVPILQSIAIKILSQPYSFKESGELRSIIQAAHAEEHNLDPIEWQEVLLLKVHSHLMETATIAEEADSRPILWDEIDNFLDSSYMEGFDAVENSACDGETTSFFHEMEDSTHSSLMEIHKEILNGEDFKPSPFDQMVQFDVLPSHVYDDIGSHII